MKADQGRTAAPSSRGVFGLATGGLSRRTVALANFSDQPSPDRSGAVSGSKSWGIERSFPFIVVPYTNQSTIRTSYPLHTSMGSTNSPKPSGS